MLGLCLSTIAVWGLWNFVARDSGWLPRISLARAICVVLLWGSLFVVVLTMISGARELLTPGAWQKNGVTYQLTPEVNAPGDRKTDDAKAATK